MDSCAHGQGMLVTCSRDLCGFTNFVTVAQTYVGTPRGIRNIETDYQRAAFAVEA